MKKNYLQDVIPPNQKRSIRDIPLPNSKEQKKTIHPVESPLEEEKKNNKIEDVRPKSEPIYTPPVSPTPPSPPEEDEHTEYLFSEKPKKKKKSKKLIYIIILLLIIFAGWFLNRSKAEVIVYAKSENTFAQNEFNISDKNLSDSTNDLGYKILRIEKEVDTVVEPTGEQEVSQKASGMIKILNEYSAEGQRLVENTRFESKNGKIYRIAESTTVPGYKEIDGKIVAGEIEVEVFADEAGDKYNSEKTTFSIPGFEGFPQYESMWAESVSDITGGFIGVKKIVSEDSKAKSLENLKNEAKKQIMEEINNSNEEFTIVFDEEDINYSKLTENDSDKGVDLKITASVDAYVFNSKELARKITDENIVNAAEGDVMISNKDNISFKIIKQEIENEDGETTTEEKLSVEGNVEISWIIDAELIKSELSGHKRNEFGNIISNQSGVSKAEVSLSPFWKNTFPKESKIEILIQK